MYMYVIRAVPIQFLVHPSNLRNIKKNKNKHNAFSETKK